MNNKRKPEIEDYHKFGTKSIDMIALAVALSWVAATIGFSWWTGGTSMLVWLIRGMWGAIFIYATVFLLLHAVVLKVRSTKRTNSSKEKKKEVEQDTLADLQAADSGDLARIIASNVTE